MNAYRAAARALYERADDSHFFTKTVAPLVSILHRFAARPPKTLALFPWGSTERWASIDHQEDLARWLPSYDLHRAALYDAVAEWIRTDRAALASHKESF